MFYVCVHVRACVYTHTRIELVSRVMLVGDRFGMVCISGVLESREEGEREGGRERPRPMDSFDRERLDVERGLIWLECHCRH